MFPGYVPAQYASFRVCENLFVVASREDEMDNQSQFSREMKDMVEHICFEPYGHIAEFWDLEVPAGQCDREFFGDSR